MKMVVFEDAFARWHEKTSKFKRVYSSKLKKSGMNDLHA